MQTSDAMRREIVASYSVVITRAAVQGMTRSGEFGRHCERSVQDALSARAATVSCATYRLHETIFSCGSFIE